MLLQENFTAVSTRLTPAKCLRHVTVQRLTALRINITHSLHVRIHDTLAITSNCGATPPIFASVYVLSTKQALLLGLQ